MIITSEASAEESLVAAARQERKDEPFWKTKPLGRMSLEEWESLCDGCGKCCLHKIEYEDTREVEYTEVACGLLDIGACRCTDYAHRTARVPDCVQLTPGTLTSIGWLPPTCAYRLISEGKDLFDWHPLISGDPESVHRAGVSVRGRCVAEREAGDLEDHVVEWPNEDVNDAG